MKYIVKYYIKSKYSDFKRIKYVEFDSIGELIKFIISNKINDFTIYELNDNILVVEDGND